MERTCTERKTKRRGESERKIASFCVRSHRRRLTRSERRLQERKTSGRKDQQVSLKPKLCLYIFATNDMNLLNGEGTAHAQRQKGPPQGLQHTKHAERETHGYCVCLSLVALTLVDH